MNRLSGALSPVALSAGCLILAGFFTTGCGKLAADDASAPFTITVSQTYVTIGNQSGSAFADGLIELVPAGVLGPYRMQLPRVESGATRDMRFDLFSGVGGARFRRGATRIKTVRVSATDIAGKTYKREVPFE
jgi:hypothetical protein